MLLLLHVVLHGMAATEPVVAKEDPFEEYQIPVMPASTMTAPSMRRHS